MTWFEEKFIAAHCHYYTIESTLLYGLILVLAAYGTYRLLMRLNVKMIRSIIVIIIIMLSNAKLKLF